MKGTAAWEAVRKEEEHEEGVVTGVGYATERARYELEIQETMIRWSKTGMKLKWKDIVGGIWDRVKAEVEPGDPGDDVKHLCR